MMQSLVDCLTDCKSTEHRKDSVWKITIEDLAMWKVCEKILPKLLNDDQEYYIQVCQDIIEHLQTEANLLCRVITGDKKRT